MSSRSIFQSHRMSLVLLVLLSVLGISAALADEESDPPGRVARLGYADGAVSLQPAGVDDWTDATLNRPLTTGDKLWTDKSSRAELDIGSAAIRLGSTTGFSFLNLDDRTAQMQITAGTAIVHVRDMNDQVFEVDTPNVAIALESPGDYRVEVNEAGDTTVLKVSNGDAEVSATGQTVALHTQQASAFVGTDQVTADAASVGAPDALDSWSLEREHRFDTAREQTGQYVSPEVAGAEDLAQYGTWQDTSDYGAVWTPTVVAAGWSPYHDGRWVWVAPWGWTWVDDAPWGFAPFHYGRWAYVDTRWCWVPGPRHVRPVYAPALVAWVGSPGASASITVGRDPGVGWFPLGPREVFVPSYRVSHNYVRNVNVSNTTIVNTTYITNVYENRVTNITYVNRNRPGAVVAVSRDVFTSSRPISGHAVLLSERDVSRFAAHGAAPAIVPVRESVLGHRPDATVRRPPVTFVNRPVVARTAPPPAPVSFARQQEAIRANGGRPLARSQITALQPAAATNARVRLVAPGPMRPMPGRGPQMGAGNPAMGGGQQLGTGRAMSDRERSLHATPIAPSQARTPPPAGIEAGERPGPNERPRPNEGAGDTGRFGGANRGPAFRNDRPPSSEQPRSTLQGRSVEPEQPRNFPQARPVEPSRTLEQSRIEQSRVEQQRIEQQRSEQQRSEQQRSEQPRVEQPRALEQPRAVEQPRMEARPAPQARPFEQPRTFQPPPQQPREELQQRQIQPPPQIQQRQEFHAPEPPRQIPQPRAEPRPMEIPRAAPPPAQQRQAPPPPQPRGEERRGGRPGEPRQ